MHARIKNVFVVAIWCVVAFLLTCGSASGRIKRKTVSSKSGKSGTISSSVVCKATASASAFSYARSAHVTAVTEAIAEACNGEGGEGFAWAIADAYAKEAAFAVAKVATSAQVESITSGNAFCCGTATATGRAWASSVASAHATAVAAAFNKHCSCKSEASAAAFGDASLFVKLIAGVYSSSEASIDCNGGAKTTEGYELRSAAFNACAAASYVEILAHATAVAVVDGQCSAKGDDSDTYADAEIVALAEADFETKWGCLSYVTGDAINTEKLLAEVFEIY